MNATCQEKKHLFLLEIRYLLFSVLKMIKNAFAIIPDDKGVFVF